MKYVILSVNDNPDYLYYTPLTVWAWKKLGWTPVTFYNGLNRYSVNPLQDLINDTIPRTGQSFISLQVSGYRSDTITQISRLYGGCLGRMAGEDILMTGDIDMIPLSDYWRPEEKDITIYGHDLTGYGEIPICYIAMTKGKWIEVMGLSSTDYNTLIKRDLDSIPNAKSEDFNRYWGVDQQLITERINACTAFDKKYVTRGQLPNWLAKGRVDRGIWSLDHSQYVDAHLHRDLYKAFQNPEHEHYALYQKKWREHMELLKAVWPNEDFDWLVKYTLEFAKLAV